MSESHADMSSFQVDQRANFLALILLDALEDGNESDINAILERNNVDASFVPVERGISPLHYACGMENAELACEISKRFLQDGADPNVRSNENMTPLHVAAIFGRVDIVKQLLKYGAQHDVVDDERKTPIHYAIEECHFEVLEAIRNHIFQHKYDRDCQKRSNESRQDSNTPAPKTVRIRDENASNVTPINRVLRNVLAADNENHDTPTRKCTPSRVHYNYDVTSPYYINITHRRHRPQPIFPATASPLNNARNIESNSSDVQSVNSEGHRPESLTLPQKSVNVFDLTEKNLKELSLATSNLERSCISMIESWRRKVESSRARRSILRQYTNVDEMLDELMNSEHLNYTNTALQKEVKSDSKEEQPKASTATAGKFLLNSNLSLGAIIQKAAQAHVLNMDPPAHNPELDSSYHTVPPLTEQLDENISANLPDEGLQNSQNGLKEKSTKNSASEYFLQMTEAYVHTDDENGLVFYETKLLSTQNHATNSDQENLNNTVSTNVTIPLDYETDELRAELTHYGDPPGFSVELQRTIRSPDQFSLIPEYMKYESKSAEYFANLQNKSKMREGHLKQSFIYMLIDPRISCNLPGESVFLDKHSTWVRFLHSVFYVGKGKTSRPYSHLYEAMKLHSRAHSQENASKTSSEIAKPRRGKISSLRKQTLCVDVFKTSLSKSLDNKKLNRILDIWRCGKGVVCLHVFHNILPSEAYTREAAIIDAFGLQHLTNYKRGDYYGPSQTWTMKEKKFLGISLLYKSLQIYLAEGESQLSPSDLI